MNTRKIIQIRTAGVNNTMQTQCDYIVTALCDDGTAWELMSGRWQKLPEIPQGDFGDWGEDE